MHTPQEPTALGKAEYLFTLAGRHKNQGDEEGFLSFSARYCAAVCNAIADGTAGADELPGALAKLYLTGDADLLFSLLQAAPQNGDNDFLARMASAAAFREGEPHRALIAAKQIRSAEERRLRQKTAEMWGTLQSPLAEEPRVHLLILSHNRVEHVEHALCELAATDYRNYAVFIADNGSSDGTWDIVRRAGDIFPEHVPVSVQSFPTNIGRPAGHNWLLTGHDHSPAEFIAIGDDDLIRVPPDWLTRMVQTARAFPGCACVGGKALSPGWPPLVHGGIRNITAFGDSRLDLTNGDEQTDIGQFDYVDIVDHVIGCLHIFDRAELEDTGLFDIRFSPCQCVDIEHHLRMRLAGKKIVFNGLIAFEHMRAMGRAVAKDSSLLGNSVGNVVKLLYKYPRDTVHKALAERREERNAWLMG